MSTTPVQAPAPTLTRAHLWRRWRVVRLHLAAPSVFIGIPCLILAGAWAVSMVIGLLIHISTGTGPGGEMRYSWAVLSPQWYFGVVGVQAIALTFPYALGLGSTRRDYWVGTLWAFGLLALGAGILLATLVPVETLTGGWGLDIRMFDALWYGTDGWWVDAYSTAALSFTVLALGATAATIYMRWRMFGVVLTGLGLAVVVLGLVAAVTLTNSWPSVLTWFGSLRIAQCFTLVLAVGVALALAGHAVIRRATPRG